MTDDPQWDEVSSWLFDFDGKPTTLRAWSIMFTSSERHVARTTISRSLFVSTVWIGTDLGFDERAPLIYESMLFDHGEGVETLRTPTRAAALAAHDQLVKRARRRSGLHSFLHTFRRHSGSF